MAERLTRPLGGGLVGRDRERGVLMSGVDSARRGVAGMVMVSGAAGTGKTALLDVCARASGAAVLRGACSPEDGDRRFHAAAALFGVEPDEAAVPVSQRLYARMVELARSGPVVVALDDAQWCDAASVAWLEMVVRRDPGLSLLVLLARRPSLHASPAGAAFGAAAGLSRVVELASLRAEDVAELAGREWGVRPHPEFVRSCAVGTGGNPALLRRLFDRLLAGGLGPVEENAPAAAEAALDLFAEALPAALDREPEFVRQVAEAVALLDSADREPVGMLSGVPDRLVGVALGQLREAGVIGAGGGLHERVRGAVLAGLPDGELDRRRRRAARVLNDGGAPPAEIGAQLVALAERDEPWMRPVLREAAAEAARSGRPDLAARLLRTVLADDPRDVAALADYARVAEERDPAAVHQALLDSLKWTDDVRDRATIGARLGRVAVLLGRASEVVGTLVGIGGALAEETARSPADGDRELRAEVEAALRMLPLWDRSAAPALDDPVPEGHTVADREVLALRSVAAMMSGAPAVGEARRALTGPPASGWAFACAGYVLSLAGETEEAEEALRGLAADGAAPWSRGVALSLRALVREAAGDLAGAQADATVALDSAGPRVMAQVALALVSCRRGEVADAARLLDGIADGPPLVRPHLLLARAALAELRGADEESLAVLTRCGTLPGAVSVPWWLDAARLLVRLGRREEARELVAAGAEAATRWGAAAARGFALLGRGIVGETGALGDALGSLSGVPWYLVRARILLGESLLRVDDRTGARAHFRDAVDLAARCGFWPLAQQARDGLVAAGGRLHARAAGVLTAGERRVAELAASGATNREIAETLLVALRTVEIHLTSAYRKLGVTGRTELAVALSDRPS
jgi:DNA-binding CsgD family transcriptional regulator